jgi:endonuclease-3
MKLDDILMPIDATVIDRTGKSLAVHLALVEYYGEFVWRSHGEPMGELVGTILSQNTSDVNSGRAFESLKQRFPTWSAVMEAPTIELAEAIHVGGLAQIKAARIQAVLQRIYAERGSFDLGFLHRMSVEEARSWLTSLKGVGPKTASCVLLFSFGMPALPVDTHVHRVSLRLGLVPPKTSPEQTSAILERMLSGDLYYSFHMHLIRHGREICKAQRPRCALCPVAGICDYNVQLEQAAPIVKETPNT